MGSKESLEHYVETYGDLVFDLCFSILRDSVPAQMAFRSIFKAIRSESRSHKYATYERSWVLRICYNKLLGFSRQDGHSVSPQDQIKMDAEDNVTTRLKEFESYFHRLPSADQVLLLLKDKHGIPYPEISTAMAVPEGSLKIRRQQALRALSEWLWNGRSHELL